MMARGFDNIYKEFTIDTPGTISLSLQLDSQKNFPLRVSYSAGVRETSVRLPQENAPKKTRFSVI